MGARPLIDYLKSKPSASEEKPEEENNENKQQEEEQQQQADPVDAFKQEYARKLGWTSKEEWTQAGRDPEMWRDHNMFLDTSPGYFERLRKKNREYKTSMERNAAAAAATLEEDRKRIREEAIREAREAATAGDADRAAAAAERAAESQVHPETQAWIARNAWFNTDPEARGLASGAVERAAKAGATISEQLEAATKAVKRFKPEYFEDDDLGELPDFITRQSRRQQEQQEEQEQQQQREVKMSQSAKVASAAAGANSARVKTPSQNKEKTFNDLPAETKALYEKYYAKKFQGRGLKPEEARERYAKSYYNNLKDN